MMKTRKAQELVLATENKPGTLAEISGALKAKGINIIAVSAWSVDTKAFFRLIASDTAAAKQALASFGKGEEKEVVIVELPDTVGALESVTSKLKNANIDLTHIYGSVSEAGKTAHLIFASSNNAKALELLSA
jgi:hypothetical protein